MTLFNDIIYTGGVKMDCDEKTLTERRARFVDLFDSTEDAIAIYEAYNDGEDFIIKDFNKSAEKAEKVKREDIIGRKVTEVFPGVKEFGLFDVFYRVWKTGISEEHPTSFYKDERNQGWRENYVLKLSSGEIAAIYKDVTEKKLAEEAIRESEKKYSLIVNGANEGICLLDKDEKVIFANKRLSEMSGYSLEEMIGKPASYFIFEEDLNDHEKRMQDRRKGLASRYERRLRHKDGTVIWCIVSGTPLFDENNLFVGSLVMITDISKQKQYERMLEAYNSIFETINKHNELEPLLNEIVRKIRGIVDCNAVKIRVLEDEVDISNVVYIGFNDNFSEPEKLFHFKMGKCMCSKVINGLTDPSLPYFTEYGSFYCNSITDLLAVYPDENLSCFKTKSGNFYESGAIIPIRIVDKVVALLYIADTEKNKIDLETILLLEKITIESGQAIERIRYVNTLFEEKELLDVTLRSIGDGVISTDAEGRIVIINNIAEKLTGWTEKEAIGRHISEVFRIINEETRQPAPNPVEKVVSEGVIVGLANHTVLISRDGTEYSIADSGAPIYSRDGRIVGVVIVFRDVTEERKTEMELQRINKLESLGILAGGIAHDFNNFLTSILGNISLARICKDEKEKDRRLEESERAALSATGLTQQLLTFAKGGLPVKKSGSIKNLLKDSTEFVLRGSNVKPIFSIQEDLWNVEIDESQIDRVIQNIVINAVQAMPTGGAIWISAENVYLQENHIHSLDAGRYIKLSIKDSGIGITKEYLGKIFEPYFTTKQKGSGLGLSICYSIIKNHGGYIDVESELGVGSNFIIYLPASDKSLPTEKIRTDLSTTKTSGKILVMDDEESIRRLMKDMLENFCKYEVFTTKDGLEAVNIYKQEMDSGHPFDAVILDLTVPGGMGGKEAIQKIQEIDPNVKAIVYSGYSNDPIMSNYKEFGFKGVILKPFRIKELSEVLYKVINDQL